MSACLGITGALGLRLQGLTTRGDLDGKTEGRFAMDENGTISPEP